MGQPRVSDRAAHIQKLVGRQLRRLGRRDVRKQARLDKNAAIAAEIEATYPGIFKTGPALTADFEGVESRLLSPVPLLKGGS